MNDEPRVDPATHAKPDPPAKPPAPDPGKHKPPGKANRQVSQDDVIEALDLVKSATVSPPVQTYERWEQAPAWVLGGASIVLAFYLAIFRSHQDVNSAWAFAIVGLFVAVILSFRSSFSIGTGAQAKSTPNGKEGSPGGKGDKKPGQAKGPS
jgi:hypothetical protein